MRGFYQHERHAYKSRGRLYQRRLAETVDKSKLSIKSMNYRLQANITFLSKHNNYA
jgi:hypothetical protein